MSMDHGERPMFRRAAETSRRMNCAVNYAVTSLATRTNSFEGKRWSCSNP